MKKLYFLFVIVLFCTFANKAEAQRTEVTFYTTMGDFTVKMWDSLAPVTVDSFLARVGRDFYDGIIFHRVIKNFMIQGGDPTGTGSGGTGTKIPDEFHSSLKNVPMALSMANTGQPNTGDCQFFINLVTNTHLDNKHTVFGMVTSGSSVVQAIGNVATSGSSGNPQDKPLTDVVMDSVRVTKWPASVNNVQAELTVNIYPNPTKGLFLISLPQNMATRVMVTNLQGAVLFETEAANKKDITVDLSGNPEGIYIIKIAADNGSVYKKLLLQP